MELIIVAVQSVGELDRHFQQQLRRLLLNEKVTGPTPTTAHVCITAAKHAAGERIQSTCKDREREKDKKSIIL